MDLNMQILRTSRAIAWILLATCLLSACGGGGGSDPTSLADAQGRWRGNLTQTAGTQSASALVLPDGQFWMLYAISGVGTRLVQGGLSVNGQQIAGSAKLFDLRPESGNALSDVTLTARVVAGSSLTLNSSDALQVGNFVSSAFESQNTSAVSITGVWRDDPITPSVQWTIGSDGALNGYGTGCTVSGTVVARQDSAAVADVQMSEDCGGAVTAWSGVALNGTSAGSLRLTLVKSDRSKAFLLELTQ